MVRETAQLITSKLELLRGMLLSLANGMLMSLANGRVNLDQFRRRSSLTVLS